MFAVRIVILVELMESWSLARIRSRRSAERDVKPAVTTTVLPTNDRRKASLSSWMRVAEFGLCVAM